MMKAKLTEHILSIIIVSFILLAALAFIKKSSNKAVRDDLRQINQFINIEFIDFSDPFHKALLKDVMNIYYPGQYDKNNKIVKTIIQYKEKEFNESILKSHLKEVLSVAKFLQILLMYLKFLLVYVLVMALTYYGVQTFGVLRFIHKKQRSSSIKYKRPRNIGQLLVKPVKIIATGVVYFILFSPAYVIAYSIRTEFNTDTTFFMVLLGVISNGLLIMYTNKFYTFLVAESRKGYVDTAIVKNLKNSYLTNTADGISYKEIFRLVKRFEGHVFSHIFKNARYQYLSTIKEQASFLITGLIIIEMALNIHGHLNYELLRQILYKNYDIVIVIVLGIFYTEKLTEIFTDFIMRKESLKYENK